MDSRVDGHLDLFSEEVARNIDRACRLMLRSEHLSGALLEVAILRAPPDSEPAPPSGAPPHQPAPPSGALEIRPPFGLLEASSDSEDDPSGLHCQVGV